MNSNTREAGVNRDEASEPVGRRDHRDTTTSKLDENVQQDAITLLIWSKKYGEQARSLVKPELYTGDYRIIADRACYYWRQYGEPPKTEMNDLIDEVFFKTRDERERSPRHREHIHGILRQAYQRWQNGMNGQFTIDRMVRFRDDQMTVQAVLGASEDYRQRGKPFAESLQERMRNVGAPAKGFTLDAPDYSLLDDRRGNLPKFPVEAIPSERLREWIERAAQSKCVFPEHVAVPFLTIASALIGNGRRIQASSSWSEPMTTWGFMVSASGLGKSPGLDATREPLNEVEADRRDDINLLRRKHARQCEHARVARDAWKARVKTAVAAGREPPPMPSEAEEPEPFITPALSISDATFEAHTKLLQARPQGTLLLTDELMAWFASMSRYNSQDRQKWLEAWDGRPHHVERVGQPARRLECLLIGVLGGIQPDRIADIFEDACDGLYARFLFAWYDQPPHIPISWDPDESSHYIEGILAKLSRLGDDPDERRRWIPLSRQASELFEEIRRKHAPYRDRLDGREREWMAKMPAHLLRLAGTLALLDWADGNRPEPTVIKRHFIDAAEALIWDYYWPHTRACLRQIGLTPQHSDARRVLRWITLGQVEQFGPEDARRKALGRRLDATQTGDVLERLAKAGWLTIKVVRTGTPGRPATMCIVNPRLLDGER
jgi:hypothetical protein